MVLTHRRGDTYETHVRFVRFASYAVLIRGDPAKNTDVIPT